jgi:hypothetical protein
METGPTYTTPPEIADRLLAGHPPDALLDGPGRELLREAFGTTATTGPAEAWKKLAHELESALTIVEEKLLRCQRRLLEAEILNAAYDLITARTEAANGEDAAR